MGTYDSLREGWRRYRGNRSEAVHRRRIETKQWLREKGQRGKRWSTN